MKKLSSVIIALFLATVLLFSIAGCSSDKQSRIDELQSQIEQMETKLEEKDEQIRELNEKDELQILIKQLKDQLTEIEGKLTETQTKLAEMEKQISELQKRINQLEKELYGSYNEAGGFYEREVNDWVSVTYLPVVSTASCYRIDVENIYENSIFFSGEDVRFVGSEQGDIIELKSGESRRFRAIKYWFENTIYIDIIAKNGNQIIGYGVIGLYSFRNDLDWKDYCKVLKFAIFPQIEGNYQTISEEQIKKAMDEIKNN